MKQKVKQTSDYRCPSCEKHFSSLDFLAIYGLNILPICPDCDVPLNGV